jgi:hypothetical protein
MILLMKSSDHYSLAEQIKKARNYLLEKVTWKPIFIITGLLATIWFLVRVIPKPSRAGYPCMRAAAPLMSGFVLYMLALGSSVLAFRKSKALFLNKNYMAAIVFLIVAIVASGTFFVAHHQKSVYATPAIANEPPDGANNPMGTAQGIIPGRVIWAFNPQATNPETTNKPDDAFWDFKNNDTLIIRGMIEESVIELTGTTSLKAAWDSIFVYHNRRKNDITRGYQPGEKIFIKINQGTASWLLTAQEKANGFALPYSGNVTPSWRANHYATTETGPFVVLNLLRQLINVAGVPQENIYVGDPMAHIYYHNFSVWFNEFPNVKYADKTTENQNRTFILPAIKASMEYSDKKTILKEASESYFEEMEEAAYLINVACLKSHVRAGITLTAKNHFGSITRSGAGHLHPSLVSVSDKGLDQSNTGYRKYRAAVDIMGHKFLGRNTMLFVVEGLFGGSESEVKPPRKWKMAPFNGNWTNSVFMSLDQVALESVCYDFLRTEFNGVNQPEKYPNWIGVDDYLHQAADAANWPTGLVYSPDGDGALKSLGVHEHWNDPVNKQYSRNLGQQTGIELKQVSGRLVSTPVPIAKNNPELVIYPNPFRNQASISFNLTEPGVADISIYTIEGRLVDKLESRYFGTGIQKLTWNAVAMNLPSGTYIVNLQLNSSNGIINQSQKIKFLN